MDKALVEEIAQKLHALDETWNDTDWGDLLEVTRDRYLVTGRAVLPIVIERCAKVAENPCFIRARDDEWDTGFNDAKRLIASYIRSLASGAGDAG